jgi:glycosyltransferase involved in cell wall biosynthesis
MESIKILWFNWRCWLHPWAGGAEAHIHEIARRWTKEGHEVTLFCGKYEGCKESEVIDGVRIERRGNPYTLYLEAPKKHLLNLRKDYDIIVDDVNGVPFFTPLWAPSIPKVVVMHHLVKDIFFMELPWHKAVIGYLAEMFIPLIYRRVPFVAVSEGTKRDLVNFGIPEDNIKVVHNGVDHKLLKPNFCQKSPHPHVVYLGRVKKYKNLNHLLRAMKIVAKFNFGKSVKLTIAGRGDYRELKTLASKLGINSYVEFLGEVSEGEKIKLLQRAWVYVTPSTREGWGLAVLESMACGTPAVGYNVTGIRDVIRNGENGVLVPYGNINALANAIVRVLMDEELRERLAENAYKWSLSFDWDTCARQLMDYIKEVST